MQLLALEFGQNTLDIVLAILLQKQLQFFNYYSSTHFTWEGFSN